MTQQELAVSVQNTFLSCVELISKKNQDYSIKEDALRNFKVITLAGVTLERGLLVRIFDKLARLSNILEKQAAVKEETIDDTILDTINYLAILRAAIKNGKKTE
jgi:hypothetical protein